MAPARAPDVTFELVDGRVVLVDPSGTELITLNPVGSVVWQALDGERDIRSLAADLHVTFAGVTAERLERDLRSYLSELAALGLVVGAGPKADARR